MTFYLFSLVNTTHALLIVTRRILDPNVANVDANSVYLFTYAVHAMNSNPARNVSNIHDQPVNDMGNAPMEPSFIFATITTKIPHMKMNKSIAVDLGIPPKDNDTAFSS